MKGLQGLAIAGAMGVVGAVCNWLYIAQRAAELEKVDFVYIKAGAKVNEGQKFQLSHLGRVSIPKKYVGNLEEVAVKWEARNTVVGDVAHKSYTTNNEILLNADLRKPPQKSVSELLSPDEISRTVLIDAQAFVAANVNPTDRVLFFPPSQGRATTSTADVDEAAGPFRILAIGNRLGSTDVAKAAGMRPSRGNSITVPLVYKDGKHDEKSRKLLDLIAKASGQGLTVSVVSAQNKAKAKR